MDTIETGDTVERVYGIWGSMKPGTKDVVMSSGDGKINFLKPIFHVYSKANYRLLSKKKIKNTRNMELKSGDIVKRTGVSRRGIIQGELYTVEKESRVKRIILIKEVKNTGYDNGGWDSRYFSFEKRPNKSHEIWT